MRKANRRIAPGASGVHVTTVSRLLGHSSTSMTLDVYSHVFPEAQRNATATLDRLVSDLNSNRTQTT